MYQSLSSHLCVVLVVPGDLCEVLGSDPCDLSELGEVFEVLGPFAFVGGEPTCSRAFAAAAAVPQRHAGMVGLVLDLFPPADPSNN